MRVSVRSFLAALLAAAAGLAAVFAASRGAGDAATPLPVHIISQGPNTVTVAWTPPPEAAGYVFKVDGRRVSNTWDGSRSTVTFGLRGPTTHTYEVVAITEADAGALTLPAPPAPPPTSTAPPTTTITTTAPPPAEQPLAEWNAPGDFGDGWEYAGTFSHSPDLSARVVAGASFDGVTKPAAAPSELRIEVDPGDQFGGSTGWRTLGHVYDPSRFTFKQGDEFWFVWADYVPAGYPGDADMWVAPFETHQTKAPNVAVTGPAPLNITDDGDSIDLHVKGGVDGQGPAGWTTKIDTSFPSRRGVWKAFAVYEKLDPGTGGALELWSCTQGTAPSELFARSGIGTMYRDSTIWPLFGLYRNQTGSSKTVTYTAGLRRYSSRAGALAWAAQLCA